jgi:hypothetical protein
MRSESHGRDGDRMFLQEHAEATVLLGNGSCNSYLAGRIRALKREEFEERDARGALRCVMEAGPGLLACREAVG